MEIVKYFNDTNHFKTEKDLCDYIELNMNLFCKELFEDEYISHEREFNLFKYLHPKINQRRAKQHSRIDFLIKCKNSNYAVEVKNRKEELAAKPFGQMLLYNMELKQAGIIAKQCIVSSFYDYRLQALIRFYGLDFDYFLFNKEYSAKV